MGGIEVGKINAELPFLGTLLKSEQDTEKVTKVSGSYGTFGLRRR